MSDNEFVDDADLEQPNVSSDGSALRKFGETQKKRADALDKQLAELRTELAKRDAAAVFTELGVPEKVRKFYHSDDYSKETVAAWVKENADVFGLNVEEQQTPEQTQQHADLESVTAASLAGQDRTTALSRDSMSAMSKDLLTKGSSLEEILGKFQIPNTPMQGPMM